MTVTGDWTKQAVSASEALDGATLQMGIGVDPDAVLRAASRNKVDLGIHTEMFSDGVLPTSSRRAR
jgi:acyl-CoA hydrolase